MKVYVVEKITKQHRVNMSISTFGTVLAIYLQKRSAQKVKRYMEKQTGDKYKVTEYDAIKT
jgi:hypothetical protein